MANTEVSPRNAMNNIDIDVIRTALDWQHRGHRVV